MSKRRQRISARLATFFKQYSRKKSPGADPNDRHYDRKMQRAVRKMKPEEMDRLMRDDLES